MNTLSPSSSKTGFFCRMLKDAQGSAGHFFVRSQLHLYCVDVLGLVKSGRVPTEKILFNQGYLPMRI